MSLKRQLRRQQEKKILKQKRKELLSDLGISRTFLNKNAPRFLKSGDDQTVADEDSYNEQHRSGKRGSLKQQVGHLVHLATARDNIKEVLEAEIEKLKAKEKKKEE